MEEPLTKNEAKYLIQMLKRIGKNQISIFGSSTYTIQELERIAEAPETKAGSKLIKKILK